MHTVSRLLFAVLWFTFFGVTGTVSAQELYFSISGKNVQVDTGDRIGQYDFWIRPVDGSAHSGNISLEVFDAALGGYSDLIYGDVSTQTTYEVFPFRHVYTKTDRAIRPTGQELTPSQQTAVTNEQRYRNRWIPFFNLTSDEPEGWVIRVQTDQGNDVNTYKMRLAGTDADKWQIVALNLSVSLVETKLSDRIFLESFFSDLPPGTARIIGEEETEIYFVDAFGNKNPANQSWDNWTSTYRGISNSWGIMTTGSSQRINNLVIEGTDEILAVIVNPQILQSESLPQPAMVHVPTAECQSSTLSVEFRGYGLDLEKTRWFIDNTTYTGRSFSHRFSAFGDFPYEALIPVQGRFFPKYLVLINSLKINQPPIIVLTNTAQTISPNERITLDASGTYDTDNNPVTFQWFVNNELRSTEPRFVFSSQTPGRFFIRLVASDNTPNSSCTTSEETIGIRVNTQPYAEIEFPGVIALHSDRTFNVKNEIDSDGDSLRFSWSGPGVIGNTNGRSVRIRHEAAGMYQLSLETTDGTETQNARYSTSIRYKVNAAPVPAFSLPEIVAPTQRVTLNGNPSLDPDGDPLTWSWIVSDGRIFGGTEHQIWFAEPGDYSVTLSVNDNEQVENSEQSLTKTIRVNAPPVPSIAAVPFTNNARVSFSASESRDSDQGIQSYYWDFGDGSTASDERTTHVYNQSGTYTVTLTVNDGANMENSIQFVTHNVRINKNPVAAIETPEIVAPDQSFTLDGTQSRDPDGEISKFEWFLNDIPLGEGAQVSASISQPGNHQIRLRVADNSDFDDAYGIATRTIRVNHPPVPKWSAIPAVTEPDRKTVFSASESNDPDNPDLKFTWIFSDGTELHGQRVERSFTSAGTYTFYLVADDNENLTNSVMRVQGSIRVNQPPIIVTNSQVRGNGFDIRLDASQSYDADGNKVTYEWILPDGSKRYESAFTWMAPKSGVHRIGLTIDDGEGLENSVVSQPVQVIINQPPVAVVDSKIDACSGQIIIFSSAQCFDPDGDAFTTVWDFGDGNTSRDSNPYHMFTSPGTYSVKLTLDDGFSQQATEAVIPVRIEGSPQAVINFNEITVCTNTPVTFDGSASIDPNGPIGAFSWDFGDASTGLGPSVTRLYTQPGSYDVVLTVIGSGSGTCSNISQATAKVSVVEGPAALFHIPTVVSPGTRIDLNAEQSRYEGNIKKAAWKIFHNDEPVDEKNGLATQFTPTIPGMYRIVLMLETDIETSCNTSVYEAVFLVNAQPVINWNVPDTLAQFQPFLVSASGSYDKDGYIASYLWKFNGETIGSGLTARLPTERNGEHVLSLEIVDNSGVQNGTETQSTDVFINAAPKPSFDIPDVVYLGEKVYLSANQNTDEDGDVLSNEWRINGNTVQDPEFTAIESRYVVELIQNDGRKVSNSIASVINEIVVQQPSAMDIKIPLKIVRSKIIRASDIGLISPYILLIDGQEGTEWKPNATGIQTIEYGWKPANELLSRYTRTLTVYEDLSFSENEVSLEIDWNPANPYVTVSAPAVNRDELTDPVLLHWEKNGRRVGVGKTVQLTIAEGVNRFTLIAEESGIAGSTPVQIPVIILVK